MAPDKIPVSGSVPLIALLTPPIAPPVNAPVPAELSSDCNDVPC